MSLKGRSNHRPLAFRIDLVALAYIATTVAAA